jgi:hypothetical protein
VLVRFELDGDDAAVRSVRSVLGVNLAVVLADVDAAHAHDVLARVHGVGERALGLSAERADVDVGRERVERAVLGGHSDGPRVDEHADDALALDDENVAVADALVGL